MNEALNPILTRLEGRAIPNLESRRSEAEHERLRRRLEAAVRAVCPAAMRDHQDDIVQVAMMAVLRQKRGDGDPIPATYLRKAAFTAMIDEMRRLRGDRQQPLDDAEELGVDAGAGPERRSMSREISAAIRSCLERLAAPRRAAVALRLLDNNVPEIARRMGWKRKQAENLVFRGMGDLRDCLREKGVEP